MKEFSARITAALGVATAAVLLAAGCQSSISGCSSDDDCTGERVCLQGRCGFPGEPSPDGGEADGPDTSPDAIHRDVPTPEDTEGDVPAPPDVRPDTPPPNDVAPDTPTPPDAGPDVAPDLPIPTDVAPDTPPRVDVSPDTSPDVPPGADPEIRVIPSNAVDFGGLPVGATSKETLVVENVGRGPLRLEDVGLNQTPSTGFAVSGPSTPRTLRRGDRASYTVSFNPPRSGRYRNSVIVRSDDGDESKIQIELRGNAGNKPSGPCLYNTPDSLNFGVVKPGQSRTLNVRLGNCSTSSTTTVTVIKFTKNQRNAFKLGSGARSAPFKLAPGKSIQLPVVFQSKTKAEVSGRLIVRSDERNGGREEIDLKGSGGGCPVAEVEGRVANRDEQMREGPIGAVAARETLRLDGSSSSAPSGNVAYTWSLRTPGGSSASLNNPKGASPQFKPDKAGTYTATLAVRDQSTGQKGCSTDSIDVVVRPKPFQLEVESQWRADHDLDLHLVRSDQQGNFPSFGDPKADVSADHLHQNWRTRPNRLDDGYHSGDDGDQENADGYRGHESIRLGAVERGRSYRIGLHLADLEGPRPIRFPATATLTLRRGNAPTLTKKLKTRFSLRNRGDYWIVWKLQTKPLNVTNVDRKQ
ncbi:MAG: choice-of-anchor D domain-containing protein [Bradymonadaceae bacterium]